MSQETPYNPLDKKNLGVSVADALLASTVHPLPPKEPFNGAGIYAIYYVGDFPVYENLSARNKNNRFEAPIYIGKAVPKGARKGGMGLERKPGKALYDRLKIHAAAINEATNLKVGHFHCRYLVLDEIWIPLGENMLIEQFKPVWNQIVEGFGNKTPGAKRFAGRKPLWDTLHPGRSWAGKMTGESKRTQEEILQAVKAFLQADREK